MAFLEYLNCNRVSKYLRFVKKEFELIFSFFLPICLISLFFYYFHQGEKLQTIKNMVLLAFKVPNNTCKIINFLLRKSGMTYIIYPSMCTANLHNCIWWWFHDRAKNPPLWIADILKHSILGIIFFRKISTVNWDSRINKNGATILEHYLQYY